ncbi:MAG: hypothetical protein SFU99_12940 [Saprospiraceae bacterium]|nr:hypothetical protein [Saprospiraceae bacterium]
MENRTYMPDFDVLKKFIESRTEKQEPILARQVVLENELIKLEDEFTQFMKGRMGKTLEDYCANLHVREQIENRMSDVRRKLRSAGYSEADIRQIWEKESFKRKNRHPASPVTEARIKYVQDFIKRAAIRV